MDSLLIRFNGDVHTKEAFKEFLIAFINQEALEKMYKREDVSHIADAKDLVDRAFEQLAIDYAIPDKERENTNTSK